MAFHLRSEGSTDWNDQLDWNLTSHTVSVISITPVIVWTSSLCRTTVRTWRVRLALSLSVDCRYHRPTLYMSFDSEWVSVTQFLQRQVSLSWRHYVTSSFQPVTSYCCCCCHDEPVRHCLYGGDKDVPKRWGIPPDSESGGIRLSLVIVDSHFIDWGTTSYCKMKWVSK